MKSYEVFFHRGLRAGLGMALAGILLAGGLSGCFLIAVGAGAAGTVAYVRGELVANLGNDYEHVVKAANQAITRLEFAKVSEKKDALGAVLIARTAQDRKIEIQLHKVGDRLTKVQIRVGVFGDEPLSLMVLDKIKAGL